MTHVLLTLAVFLVAGLGMAVGVLVRGRPMARGCDRPGGPGACAGPSAGEGGGGCGGAGACPRGSTRP